MELTTLAYAVLLALGLLGTDAVLYSGSVQVEVAAPPKTDKLDVDEATLTNEFEAALDEITNNQSVVHPPEIRSSRDQGVGMALAESFNFQKAAYALQSEIGYKSDTLRFALYVEDGGLHGLVNGSSHLTGQFQQVMSPNPGEAFIPFVQRCALWGTSQLAPYSAALFLMQKHAADQDFSDAVALAEHAKALLPPTPVSFDRALFDNLLGLIALFKNDTKTARAAFDAAMADDPTDPVPFLNAGFTDLQFDENQKAADRMEQLLRLAPPANPTLRATADMIWGAARLGLKDTQGADQLLAEATRLAPNSATAFGLRAEVEAEEGDKALAAAFERRALENTATFENYAEVAALYFHLSWKNNEPVIRNKFSNPAIVSFH
jgi:tetratricopeptide (TPR) repeat protein